jgi:glycosyltransferase involved in cell wall biosynthesis
MKIAVLNTCVPFVRGGAEHLAEALTQKLEGHGHQAMLIRIPFRWEPPAKIVESMLACRLMPAPNVDRVIALKFPAYYVPHPNKTLWLLHQFRQAYDWWGTSLQGLPDTAEGQDIRHVITQADNFHLRQIPKIHTLSYVVSNRLKKFNDIDSEILYAPLLAPGHFHSKEYGDYIFYPSRINAAKRQQLMVESFQHVKTDAKLVIAGKEEDPSDLERIYSVIKRHNLHQKVILMPRFISEQEKADLYAGALGCAYTPVDEDSYGYVTLEAFYSRKPVISCTDSGATDLLVKDNLTGYLVPPDPRAIAGAVDRLYLDRGQARRMGEAGLELVNALNISWDNVIDRLLQ